MKKVTLTFPNYDSLWLFKDKVKAVNVIVQPKKNMITALYHPEEIEVAVNEFQAVLVPKTNSIPPDVNYITTKVKAPKFRLRSRLVQLLSINI